MRLSAIQIKGQRKEPYKATNPVPAMLKGQEKSQGTEPVETIGTLMRGVRFCRVFWDHVRTLGGILSTMDSTVACWKGKEMTKLRFYKDCSDCPLQRVDRSDPSTEAGNIIRWQAVAVETRGWQRKIGAEIRLWVHFWRLKTESERKRGLLDSRHMHLSAEHWRCSSFAAKGRDSGSSILMSHNT